jgi:LVIVD repeat
MRSPALLPLSPLVPLLFFLSVGNNGGGIQYAHAAVTATLPLGDIPVAPGESFSVAIDLSQHFSTGGSGADHAPFWVDHSLSSLPTWASLGRVKSTANFSYAAPVLSSYGLPSHAAQAVALSDDLTTAYAVLGGSGFCVYDVSSPPAFVATACIPVGSIHPYDLQVRGNFAYMLAIYAGKVVKVDVSDRAQPVVVTTATAPFPQGDPRLQYNTGLVVAGEGTLSRIFAGNSLAYRDAANPSHPGVAVFDSDLSLLGSVRFPVGNNFGVLLDSVLSFNQETLYCVDQMGYLHAVDVRDPSNMVHLEATNLGLAGGTATWGPTWVGFNRAMSIELSHDGKKLVIGDQSSHIAAFSVDSVRPSGWKHVNTIEIQKPAGSDTYWSFVGSMSATVSDVVISASRLSGLIGHDMESSPALSSALFTQTEGLVKPSRCRLGRSQKRMIVGDSSHPPQHTLRLVDTHDIVYLREVSGTVPVDATEPSTVSLVAVDGSGSTATLTFRVGPGLGNGKCPENNGSNGANNGNTGNTGGSNNGGNGQHKGNTGTGNSGNCGNHNGNTGYNSGSESGTGSGSPANSGSSPGGQAGANGDVQGAAHDHQNGSSALGVGSATSLLSVVFACVFRRGM